jgi:hypothetical protein
VDIGAAFVADGEEAECGDLFLSAITLAAAVILWPR